MPSNRTGKLILKGTEILLSPKIAHGLLAVQL